MKILLLCTAHNSLSQRLELLLSPQHHVSVEYALSPETVVEAVKLASPHLIICPFLTTLVPKEVYSQYLTLIIHPGPPGDAGPSALDWLLMGDDGEVNGADDLLSRDTLSERGRSHWGVTVLQAIEEFDAGPIWAYDQFEVDIDEAGLTKSALYRGAVTRAAMTACLAAIERIRDALVASVASPVGVSPSLDLIGPYLRADPAFRKHSVTTGLPFAGGQTHHRPLLRANQRAFDVSRHSAREISRRIRCADSQPGCLSTVFGPGMYLYGGTIEEGDHVAPRDKTPGSVIELRDDAVCIATRDGKGVWVTHLRKVKRTTDTMLWVKVPAAPLLAELGVLDASKPPQHLPPLPLNFARAPHPTFQEIHVEYETLDTRRRVAYVTADFYNGAMSAPQCHRLSAALSSTLATHTPSNPLSALVMLGGASYFSNGIHLNVIEAAADPSLESWANINAIDDVCHMLLADCAARGITTIAALRGNAAAGGVALAANCDVVVAGENVVLNPAYRALGLHGSEYHSISYPGRCGQDVARHLLRDMMPLSAAHAHQIKLVDTVLPGYGADLERNIRSHVRGLVHAQTPAGLWKREPSTDVSPLALASARMRELAEMSKDFWSARSLRYHSRRRDFVRKAKPTSTPLRFALHRRVCGGQLDEEETDAFDSIDVFEAQIVQQIKESVLQGSGASLQRPGTTPVPSRSGTPIGSRNKTADVPSRPLNAIETKRLEPVFSCYYT